MQSLQIKIFRDYITQVHLILWEVDMILKKAVGRGRCAVGTRLPSAYSFSNGITKMRFHPPPAWENRLKCTATTWSVRTGLNSSFVVLKRHMKARSFRCVYTIMINLCLFLGNGPWTLRSLQFHLKYVLITNTWIPSSKGNENKC